MSETTPFQIPTTGDLHWFKVPPKVFFEPFSIRYLAELKDLSKIFIVSDRMIYKLGYVERVMEVLKRRRNQVEIEIYIDVPIEPTTKAITEALNVMNTFGPDNIIAIGGGSVMCVAKIMWMLYEHPELKLQDIPTQFADIKENVFSGPEVGEKARLICVPTTSGNGSEVSPFCILVDEKTNTTYPIAHYNLIPSVAIVDPEFTYTVPKRTLADNGFDMLSHSIEAYISTYANDFANGMCLEALQLIFKNLVNGYNGCSCARANLHNASTIAGMAHGNAYLGLVHALAYKIANHFHIHHGRVAGILLPHIIRYNAKAPIEGQSQLKKYDVMEKFGRICDRTGLNPGNNAAESLASECEKLLKGTESATGFAQCGIDEKEWKDAVHDIAVTTLESQYSKYNPKKVTVPELKEILIASYKPIA
ncbi:alcohol dehydrogenase, putative [Entamoeba histolytica HM-1:IMSS-B]|uniref:Alcohol dehydrogenase, putative n=5 Tax=Entamoeba TaxID=5758 RepID=S0B1T5_ENTHI|nr:alcohol dehydrogenase, putative [Entamoeba histolytica KU27]EMH74349.1 alcohol dehydrogenase, putative [Entamoeba histolytica HM-1:IMSS-B]ENY60231.1 alcohol dehydrogenase, putative [Entamoeba histolytica HM-1:IMSS-A]BAN38311.1 alcohol dehydrogenase, putative [Entamoeba histolytica]BAN39782.1 alcohol dehydrogenase, putative [Entamoeba histolytica]